MTSMAARLALRRTAQSCLQTNIAEASTSSLIRNFASSSRCPAASPSKDPKPVETPSQFMSAIAKPRRGELSSIIGLLGEDASWESLNKLSRIEMKKAGVNVKERRYFLWAREKFKQGEDPNTFAIDVKPKKVVRGWGARVQKGIRVRGRRRPGEK